MTCPYFTWTVGYLRKHCEISIVRIMTFITNNLKKEDHPEFEDILKRKDSRALLIFAREKIPQFEAKLLEEIQNTNLKFQEIIKKYAT